MYVSSIAWDVLILKNIRFARSPCISCADPNHLNWGNGSKMVMAAVSSLAQAPQCHFHAHWLVEDVLPLLWTTELRPQVP